MEKVQVGQLVRSVAGRDKGSYYLIYDVLDESFVRVINGDKKKLSNPKRKNIKHLELFPVTADDIREKLGRGDTVTETDVLKTIKNLGDSHTNG